MSSPLRVLVVEDHEIDARLLLHELQRGGYELDSLRVDSADDMKRALDEREWDVVLSDHSMPRFSAPAALDLLKRSGLDLPFIVVSGAIGEETAVALMKAGAHDYVLKGNLVRLVPAVQRELREAVVRRERRRAEEEIRTLNEDLERRVLQRTAELEATNAELAQEIAERQHLMEQLWEANQQLTVATLQAQEMADVAQRHADERDALLGREQAARAEAQRQAAQMSALLTSLRHAVTVVDGCGHVILRNEAAMELSGVPEASARDVQSYAGARLLSQDGVPLPLDQWPVDKLLSGKLYQDEEHILERSDGSRRRIISSGAAVLDEHGKVSLAVVVARDVTEVRQLEEMRQEYVSLISHDLRNPLTSVLGAAQLLRKGLAQKGLDEETRKAEMIVKNAWRMESMVQDLAESARLEAKQLQLHQEPTDLVPTMLDLVERAGTPADKDRIQVDVVAPVPPVLIDRERIERAITNLLSNALKYSHAEHPITVRIEPRDGKALLSVSDQGVGIPPEDLPHVFERHFRAKTAGQREGLGLGLYITRLIAEAHGGNVSVESKVGEGSTFYLTLPLA